MKKVKYREDEIEKIIEHLSSRIQANVQKFNPQKKGLEPEDLVQEVRIKLWKLIKSEKKILNYSSYIKKLVNSIVIDQIRISRRHEKTIGLEKQNLLQHESLRGNPVSPRKDVSKVLNELSESRRSVVRFFLLGLNIQEIAKVLNKTEAGTRNLLYRGLIELKTLVKSKGVDSND